MKILGIDYGKKWIGLAISDDGRRLAFAYKTLENNDKIFSALNEIVKKEEIYKIIIGLPLNKEMKPTVDFENEIFTSKAADKLGAKNQHAAAAAIFLQSYLDRM